MLSRYDTRFLTQQQPHRAAATKSSTNISTCSPFMPHPTFIRRAVLRFLLCCCPLHSLFLVYSYDVTLAMRDVSKNSTIYQPNRHLFCSRNPRTTLHPLAPPRSHTCSSLHSGRPSYVSSSPHYHHHTTLHLYTKLNLRHSSLSKKKHNWEAPSSPAKTLLVIENQCDIQSLHWTSVTRNISATFAIIVYL